MVPNQILVTNSNRCLHSTTAPVLPSISLGTAILLAAAHPEPLRHHYLNVLVPLMLPLADFHRPARPRSLWPPSVTNIRLAFPLLQRMFCGSVPFCVCHTITATYWPILPLRRHMQNPCSHTFSWVEDNANAWITPVSIPNTNLDI
jgi:hypothetical protein